MAIDYERLKAWPIPDATQTYAEKDAILYALGIGFGDPPTNAGQLRFIYERDLEAFPTLAVVLATGASWSADPATGITYSHLLHAEQQFELHRPLPVRGAVRARTRVVEIIDKGEGRGAIVVSARELFFDGEDTPTATLRSSAFCRADGGFGGPVTASPKAHAIPERPADASVSARTLPQQALIYRLSGDYNPLHADPEAATTAGFRAPILHGLCSFGVSVKSALTAAEVAPSLVTAGGVRFTSPVYPGETLKTEVWRDDDTLSFRTTVVEREVLSLNSGWLRLGPMSDAILYADYTRLLVERRGRVVHVALNRPDRLNAVDARMHEELSRIFDDLNRDPECDVAVLTGAGRAFSAGGDADWMVALDAPAEWRRKTVESRRIWISLMDLEKPLICKLNGPATGMCATIAALCDVVIGSTDARLGDTHLRLGLAAADGCSAVWPFIVGLQRAKDLLFRGAILSAQEAFDLGLITRLVEPEALDAAVDDYVAELLQGPVRALQLTKMAFNFQLKQLVLPAIENALNLLELSNFSDEHRTAVAAFRDASQARKDRR